MRFGRVDTYVYTMLLYSYVSGITHVVCPEGLKVETLQLGMWDDDVDPMPLHVILLSIVSNHHCCTAKCTDHHKTPKQTT